jgi:hypothetical protein
VSSLLQQSELLAGTFAAQLNGDLTATFAGAAHLIADANGGLTLELQAAASSEMVLISARTADLAPGSYRVWGDDCEVAGIGPAAGEVVFRINAQGGLAEQWTLSAHQGWLLVAAVDARSMAGQFDAKACGERIGSTAELAVVLRGSFNAQREGT